MNTLQLILLVWGVGGAVVVFLIILAEGWAALVEDMEADNPGYPLLSPKQSVYGMLLVAFVAWPYLLIESIIRLFNPKP